MKQILIVLLSIAVLLGACSPAPTTEPSVDIQATVNALSKTAVADILTKQPTITPLPSETKTIETITPTLSPPTNTPVVTETVIGTDTATSVPLVGCFAPAGVGNGPVGLFRIENNTGKTIEVDINGTSTRGEKPIFCSYSVTLSFNFTIQWGSYSYWVFLTKTKKFSGTFVIGNKDKTTMRVFNDKTIIVGP